MNILIANVGNIRSNEIKVLAAALNKKHTVTIASMGIDSSLKAQAISFGTNPVQVKPIVYKETLKNTNKASSSELSAFDRILAYEFYSTPADAISVMLGEILTHKPDLVICGLNNATHLGQDIYSSSNIGMAMESAFFDVPSIAVGIERQVGGHSEEACQNAVKFLEKNIEKLVSLQLPRHTFLNINVPTAENYKDIKGIKITKMGKLARGLSFEEKTDPKGGKYYWARIEKPSSASEDDSTCIAAFEKGYITVTPICCDATAHEVIDGNSSRLFEKNFDKNNTQGKTAKPARKNHKSKQTEASKEDGE